MLTSIQRPKCRLFVIGVSASSILFAPVLFAFSFSIIPSTGADSLLSALIFDSAKKFNASALSEPINFTETYSFFNITNAYELQTQVPAPKPIFREIIVPMNCSLQTYDFKVEDDGAGMSTKLWMHCKASNPADLNLPIVHLNKLLLQTVQFAGSETLLVPVLSAVMGDPVVAEQLLATVAFDGMAATLRADGTGPMNVGPFTRRTVAELLEGFQDPLFAPDGLYLGSAPTGFLFPFLSNSIDEQIAMLSAAPAAFSEMVQSASRTGKNDVDDMHNLVRYFNKSILSQGDLFYPGWGSDGRVGTPLDFAGHETLVGQAPRKEWPNIFEAGVPPKVSGPSRLSVFDESLNGLGSMRVANYSAVGDESLHDALHCTTYEMDPQIFGLTVDGVPDAACAATASCDFMMRYEGLFDVSQLLSAPVAMTLPYLGLTPISVRDAVTILSSTGSTELTYDATTMQPKIWVEPFTGAHVQTHRSSQYNLVADKVQLDGSLFSNIFSADTDNDDVFVLPWIGKRAEIGISKADATKFADAFRAAYLMMLLAFVMGLWNLLWAPPVLIVCVMRLVKSTKKDNIPTSSKTSSTASKDGKDSLDVPAAPTCKSLDQAWEGKHGPVA